MTIKENQEREVLSKIRAKEVRGVHIANPCGTFTIYGDNDRTVKPLFPRGKPGLSATRQSQIDVANVLTDFTWEVIELCILNNVSVTSEMPAFRGAKDFKPYRAYWEQNSNYATMCHFPEGARIITGRGR